MTDATVTPLVAHSTTPIESRTNWARRALCRGAHASLEWYSDNPAMILRCKQVCTRCAVSRSCLDEALKYRDPHGIWGGTTGEERDYIAVQRGLPLPATLPLHGTHGRYANHGCRCNSCRRAHNEYECARLRNLGRIADEIVRDPAGPTGM